MLLLVHLTAFKMLCTSIHCSYDSCSQAVGATFCFHVWTHQLSQYLGPLLDRLVGPKIAIEMSRKQKLPFKPSQPFDELLSLKVSQKYLQISE